MLILNDNISMEDNKITQWDMRFIKLAKEVATWSKDPSTKIGAVIVSPDRRDIKLGYNGFARKMKDSPEFYENRELKYSRIIHGEINAIILAKCSLDGYTLYTWPFMPCDRCAPVVIQSGITRVVAPLPSNDKLERWKKSFDLSLSYFEEAGVEVVQFSYNNEG